MDMLRFVSTGQTASHSTHATLPLAEA